MGKGIGNEPDLADAVSVAYLEQDAIFTAIGLASIFLGYGCCAAEHVKGRV